jgi:hypothetical protein
MPQCRIFEIHFKKIRAKVAPAGIRKWISGDPRSKRLAQSAEI